jgi:patatin-related protein
MATGSEADPGIMTVDTNSGTAVELRVALVCFGGVSLAVYMHGVVKELERLVRASRALDAGDPDTNPFPPTDTTHHYFAALAAAPTRTTVTVDVIAGTSAGGINGVTLAKSVATGADQDAITGLWLDDADLRHLLRPWVPGPLLLRAATSVAALPLRMTRARYPLSGKYLSTRLAAALSAMDKGVSGSPVPPGAAVDLYVTATDLEGVTAVVPTGVGGASERVTDYGQVFRFVAGTEGRHDLGPDNTPELAFAARATSAFPGAFPPVSLASFRAEAAGVRRDLDPNRLGLTLTGDDPAAAARTWYADGGLLDNAPFDLAVRAIAAKRADGEVIRRLVYIEPDPGAPLTAAVPTRRSTEPTPVWLRAVTRSLLGVRGSHSFRSDLLRLRDLNHRIAEVGAVSRVQETSVLALFDDPRIANAGVRLPAVMREVARERLGPAYGAYVRLAAEDAVTSAAEEVATRLGSPPGSDRATLVVAVGQAWLRSLLLWTDPDAEQLAEVLAPLDVPYRLRRLSFILAGINDLYRPAPSGAEQVPRAGLDRLKARAWDAVETCRTALRRAVAGLDERLLDVLRPQQLGALDDPDEYAQLHAAAFLTLFTAVSAALRRVDLPGDDLDPVFPEVTADWAKETADALSTRYLAFAVWDAALYPIAALSQLPQLTPIGVAQFSPLTATRLSPPADGRKLQGTTIFHFGGFMRRSWRENDYLWGRLDTVESNLRLLSEATGITAGDFLDPALSTVLDAESALTSTASLRGVLRGQLNTSRRTGPDGPASG